MDFETGKCKNDPKQAESINLILWILKHSREQLAHIKYGYKFDPMDFETCYSFYYKLIATTV